MTNNDKLRTKRQDSDKKLSVESARKSARIKISPKSVIIFIAIIFAASLAVKKIVDCNGDARGDLPNAADGIDDDSIGKHEEARHEGSALLGDYSADSGESNSDEERAARLLSNSCMKLGGYSNDRTGIYAALQNVTDAAGVYSEDSRFWEGIALKCGIGIGNVGGVLSAEIKAGNVDVARFVREVTGEQCDEEVRAWRIQHDKDTLPKAKRCHALSEDSEMKACVDEHNERKKRCNPEEIITCVSQVQQDTARDCGSAERISPREKCLNALGIDGLTNKLFPEIVEEARDACVKTKYDKLQTDREKVNTVLLNFHAMRLGTLHLQIVNPEVETSSDELAQYKESLRFLLDMAMIDPKKPLSGFGMLNWRAFEVRFINEVVKAMGAKKDKANSAKFIGDIEREYSRFFVNYEAQYGQKVE
ncbi:MAG: hypothetical protein WCT53_01675 [Candidatus Gracilibacteria bacterium]